MTTSNTIARIIDRDLTVEIKMPPAPTKFWTPPTWTKNRKPTYEERLGLIDQILVKLPKVSR